MLFGRFVPLIQVEKVKCESTDADMQLKGHFRREVNDEIDTVLIPAISRQVVTSHSPCT
jgi:hypothetical protein